jgi:hypothetical protein
LTVYSTPPWNSMPRFSPFMNSPLAATITMIPEMAYQSRRRPTKSMEMWPS